MRYQVPQYLELEDRIFGPLTLKQFLFLAGGLGGAYALYAVMPAPFGVIAGLLLAGFCAALGFGQLNGRPLLVMAESVILYAFSRKLYLWKKIPKPIEKKEEAKEAASSAVILPRLSESKLKDLAWGLDIQETLTGSGAPGHPDDAPLPAGRMPTIPPGII